jgi:hypothetical protein
VLEAVSGIKGDYEKSRVLQTIAQKYQLQGTLREAYIRSAQTIGGEYERNRVLALVVRRAEL